MPDLSPEQLARKQIDAMLVAAGWVVQDYKAFNPSAARGIVLREAPMNDGRCDYLFLVDRKALGILEAKKEGTLLSTVADQSAHYGTNLPDFLRQASGEALPFFYESTGVETFFRDQRDPHPRSRRVFNFHRPETLAAWAAESDTLRHRLREMPFAHPLTSAGMRECQVEANTGLEKSLADDRQRSLIQMSFTSSGRFLVGAMTLPRRSPTTRSTPRRSVTKSLNPSSRNFAPRPNSALPSPWT